MRERGPARRFRENRRAPSVPDPQQPLLVVADASGRLFEVPGLWGLVRSGGSWALPQPEALIPLPEGSLLFHLPGRRPVGWRPDDRRPQTLTRWRGREVFAAAAFLPPAYTHLHLAAWQRDPTATPLPLYAYSAVAYAGGAFVTSAVRVDPDRRQDLALFDEDELEQACARTLAKFPGNRLAQHLVENCARSYCCPAARNFVLGRWEAPLPTSPACNADCVGCLSLQPTGQMPVAQPRLSFCPSAAEVVEVAVAHLEAAPRPVVSFGQGCEGEPLLRADLVAEAIRGIRARTRRGVININTNASQPDAVEQLVAAGLDSIRISVNSCQPHLYERYFRPRGYTLADVIESGRRAAAAGRLVSLNYFVFPGLTDTDAEWRAFERLTEAAGVRFVQARNLNLDPDVYLSTLGLPPDAPAGWGVAVWLERLRARRPPLRVGYFNPSWEDRPPA